MTTYTVNAAFNVVAYVTRKIEADSPEEAITKLKEMEADDGLWSNWVVDYGGADQHRIISFSGPDDDNIPYENLHIGSPAWKALFG